MADPQPYMWQPYPQQTAAQQRVKAEGAVAKVVMAVFASILIGLSIIFFAMLVFPTLSDAAKLAVIYVVCAAFAVIGTLLLVFLNSNNKVFLTISLCGAGLMYTAFAVTYYVFDLAQYGILFFLVLLWSVFCAVFGKEYSLVYQMIGQLMVFGLFVTDALFLESRPVSESVGTGRFVWGIVSYVAALAVFFVVNHRRDYEKNWLNFTALALSVIVFALYGEVDRTDVFMPEKISGAVLLVLMLSATLLSLLFYRVDEKKSVSLGIFNSLYLIGMLIGILLILPGEIEWVMDYGRHLIVLAAVVVWLVVMEVKFGGKKTEGALIWQITALIAVGISAIAFDDEMNIMTLTWVISLAAFLYGYLRNRASYKIAGLVYGACFLFADMYIEEPGIMLMLAVILLAVAGLLLFIMKNQYRVWHKILFFLGIIYSYFAYMRRVLDAWIGESFGDKPVAELIIAAAVLITVYLFAKLPSLQKDLITGQKENAFWITTGVVNIFYMLAICTMMGEEDNKLFCVLLILLGACSAGMNTVNLIKTINASWPALYIGIKWYVLILVSAASLGCEGIGFSLIALFYALLCIAAGFFIQTRLRNNYRNVRILGLVLVCFALLKLLVYDIYYSSNLVRAVGFFAAGLLCFAISFVYHLVEKRMKKSERNEL